MAGGKRKDNKGRILQSNEYQRKNGTYEWRYKDADHNQKAIYAETLTKLREQKKRIMQDLMDGINTSKASQTLGDLVAQTNKLRNYHKQSTIEHYDRLTRFLRKFEISNSTIGTIKESDCREFIVALTQYYANNTTKQILEMCKRAMGTAVRDDIIRKNPFDFNWGTMLPKETKKKRFLTNDEFDSLIEFAQSNNIYRFYVPHLIFLRETGLRIGEFAALTLSDIDLENKWMTIRHQLKVDTQSRELYIDAPKTDSSIATIPLTNAAVEALGSIIGKARGETCSVVDTNGKMVDGLFVLGKNAMQPLPSAQWYDIFYRLKKAYNAKHPEAPLEFTPHTLRHTAASRMINDGVNLKAVQKMLRHATSYMTLSIYADQTADDTARELERVYG